MQSRNIDKKRNLAAYQMHTLMFVPLLHKCLAQIQDVLFSEQHESLQHFLSFSIWFAHLYLTQETHTCVGNSQEYFCITTAPICFYSSTKVLLSKRPCIVPKCLKFIKSLTILLGQRSSNYHKHNKG